MISTENLKIKIPEPVKDILDTLRQGGFEAYVVGGCVRDAILGSEPKDWDITTSALPAQVKSLFSNTADTGIQHGTVMVIKKGVGYEVTTYRVDGEYKDGRHPESVSFTRSLEEDLKRRDFTINALAYDPKEGLVDLFDGISDLKRRTIRCVRDPDERFAEDALRIMRAVRFSAQLDFEIDTASLDAIGRHAENLKNVSMERIRVEFEKTLLSNKPERTGLFSDLGMEGYIIPDKQLSGKCFDAKLAAVYPLMDGEEARKRVLRLSAFFTNLNAEEAKRALRLLKYDNKTMALVSGIIACKEHPFEAERTAVKRAWKEMGRELFDLVLDYRRAFAVSEGNAQFEPLAVQIRELEQEILDAKEAYQLSQLALNGSDLIREGISDGKQIGMVLEKMLDLVIEHPEYNEKKKLIQTVKELREGL